TRRPGSRPTRSRSTLPSASSSSEATGQSVSKNIEGPLDHPALWVKGIGFAIDATQHRVDGQAGAAGAGHDPVAAVADVQHQSRHIAGAEQRSVVGRVGVLARL